MILQVSYVGILKYLKMGNPLVHRFQCYSLDIHDPDGLLGTPMDLETAIWVCLRID